MTNIGAAFTVRFLRNGDTITVKRDIVKTDGSGAALFQMGCGGKPAYYPSDPQIRRRLSRGTIIGIVGIQWCESVVYPKWRVMGKGEHRNL